MYTADAVDPVREVAGIGEKKLLAALLKRAVLDYLGESGEHAVAAEQWIFDDLQVRPVKEYTFLWVCEHLGIEGPELASQLSIEKRQRRGREIRRYLEKAR